MESLIVLVGGAQCVPLMRGDTIGIEHSQPVSHGGDAPALTATIDQRPVQPLFDLSK